MKAKAFLAGVRDFLRGRYDCRYRRPAFKAAYLAGYNHRYSKGERK